MVTTQLVWFQGNSRLNTGKHVKAEDVINTALSRPKSSVCPLLRTVRGTIEQFASGVLVQIGEARFLLTAAHATDEKDIMIPGTQGLTGASGQYSYTRLPSSGERKTDLYDIAFVRLDEDVVANLHPDFSFLNAYDANLEDRMASGDAYSVIGFPARRSSSVGSFVETSLLVLTGSGVGSSEYEDLGLSTNHHLLLRFRRKKAIDFKTRRRSAPCLPEGMSGGGIFAWSKKIPDPKHLSQPHLVGVVHTHDSSLNAFLGTRLLCYIRCIRDQHPDLPIMREADLF